MARQINTKAILRALAVVFIVAGLSIIVGRITHVVALANVLKRAQALADAKEYDKAAELCKVHLSKHEKDTQAWMLYADLQVKAGRAPLAAEAYRQVLELDAANYDALAWLARFSTALAMGPPGGRPPADASARWRQVENYADRLAKLAPDKPDGYRYMAQAQVNLGKPEAEATLKYLIEKHTTEENAYFTLAELADRKGAPVAEWRPFIDDCLQKNPKSWSARLGAYRLFTARKVAGAEKYLEEAIALAPDERAVVVEAGISHERSARQEDLRENTEAAAKEWDAAWKCWGKLRDVAPDDSRSYAALARIALARGNSEEAVSTLRDGLQKAKMPDELVLRYQLTGFLIDTGGWGEAFEELDRLKELAPSWPQTAFLEGYGFLVQGRLETARTLLERAAKGLPDVFQVHLVLGACYLEVDEPGLAKAEFLAALEQYPGSIDGHVFLARALLACGEYDAALEHARRAAKDGPKRLNAWLTLAQILGSRGPGGSPTKESLQEAVKAAQTAVDIKATTEALILLARLSNAAGKSDEIESILQKEPTDAKNTHRLKIELARYYRGKDEIEKARQAYDDAVKASGESIELKLLGIDLFERPEPDVVGKKLREMADEVPGEDAIPARQALATFYLRQGQREKAIEQLKAIGKADPSSSAPWRRLLRMALDDRDNDQARKYLDRITKIEGSESSQSVCDWAEYEILANGRKAPLETFLKVQERMQKICERTPSARAFIILGDANRLGGRPAEAIRCYQRALDANPRMVTVGAVLIGALSEAGRDQEANAELARLVRIAPSSNVVLDLQFHQRRREGNLAGALEIKKHQLDARPNDPNTLIEYAQLLRINNDAAGAEEALRKAHTLAPDSPAAVSALAFFLRASDKEAEGL